MADITIPDADAREFARMLRTAAPANSPRTSAVMRDVADLLDPLTPSLRDEVVRYMQEGLGKTWDVVADDILTVVRRYVETLPVAGYPRPVNEYRDDVLRLLGGVE